MNKGIRSFEKDYIHLQTKKNTYSHETKTHHIKDRTMDCVHYLLGYCSPTLLVRDEEMGPDKRKGENVIKTKASGNKYIF